jgi:hypothetical protein
MEDIIDHVPYPWTLVHTDAGEAGDPLKDHRPRHPGFEEIHAPDRGRGAVTGLEDDGGAALPPALEIQAPAATDLHKRSDVIRRGDRD